MTVKPGIRKREGSCASSRRCLNSTAARRREAAAIITISARRGDVAAAVPAARGQEPCENPGRSRGIENAVETKDHIRNQRQENCSVTLAATTKVERETAEQRTQLKQRIGEGISYISGAAKAGSGNKPAERGRGGAHRLHYVVKTLF